MIRQGPPGAIIALGGPPEVRSPGEDHERMGRQRPIFVLLLFGLAVGVFLGLPQPRHTRVDLVDLATGRTVLSVVLRDGEQATLTWTNSLFGLPVTEVFVAERGTLVLRQVTFDDPRGVPPPHVTPADVEDLYHTGGAFTSREIRRPFTHVVFRIGEIGNPKLAVREQIVDFKQEVGFGGRIALTVHQARFWDSAQELVHRLMPHPPGPTP